MKDKMKRLKIKLVKIKDKAFVVCKKARKEQLTKTTGLRLIEVIVIVAVATFVGIAGGSYFTYSYLKDKQLEDNKDVNINKDLKELSDIYENISNNYYEEVDREKLLEAAIQGMLVSLGDDYASYFNESEKSQFDERMTGEYYGIGIELVKDTDSNIVITNVFDDTPAQKAGLKIGDIIKELEGKSTADMTSSDVASAIKTSSKKTVALKISSNGTEKTVEVTKKKVTLKSVETNLFNQNNKKIGYINISIFANNTYEQFKDAVESLEKKKIDSLIIDVRDNSGGYLYAVERMISLFLPKDTVIYQLQTKDEVSKITDNTEAKRDYPVAILINGQSASASEILAAAFKEKYNSEIIGETSYGKGKVQQTEDLGNGTMIKFTTQKWLTPNGNWINGTGVEPTIKVTLDENYQNNPTDENDNQLQKAIETLAK